MRILEIGPAIAGPTFPEAETLDCVARDGVDHVADWGRERLPFDDGMFDMIYASHVLEHVPWYYTHDALTECHRILKPTGELEVWVPDFRKLLDVYLSGRFPDENWTPFNDEREPMKWLAGRLLCGTRVDEESSWHRAVFDERYLRLCLRNAGFKGIQQLMKQPDSQPVSHEFINLGMSASKCP